MSNETNIVPLVDVLSEQLGERVVMCGDDYVVLSNNSKIENRDIAIAKATREAMNQKNNQYLENIKARKYLNDTDWLIIREIESGKIVNDSIKLKRAEARLLVKNHKK